MPEQSCAAVILAAGASTRLGQPKQLVSIQNEALLSRIARMAREAGCDPVIVVLGFGAEQMRTALAGMRLKIVRNEDWRSGMGSSLRRGVAALHEFDPYSKNVLVLVCDQLAVSAELLRKMLQTHAQGERGITASRYSGRAGVPAVFCGKYFAELMQIEGDRGARGILERYAHDVNAIEFEDGAQDLDTPDQLRDIR